MNLLHDLHNLNEKAESAWTYLFLGIAVLLISTTFQDTSSFARAAWGLGAFWVGTSSGIFLLRQRLRRRAPAPFQLTTSRILRNDAPDILLEDALRECPHGQVVERGGEIWYKP